MKRYLLIFVFIAVCRFADAQSWQSNGSAVLYTSGINIGIGTSSPQELLHVSSSSPYPRAIVQSSNSSGAPGFAIADNTGSEVWTWQYSIPQAFTGFFLAGIGNIMVLTNSGNVGIGTEDTKGYRLAVNGSAVFTSAFVKPYGNWPDYVFKKDYSLPSLDSVSAFIQKNQHLPGIPSADSVQAKGIDLGGNQVALLKKIEELTLYAINQQKAIDDLKETQRQLQAQNDRLERLLIHKKNNHGK